MYDKKGDDFVKISRSVGLCRLTAAREPSVPVKAELDNADGALKPGMFAEIEGLTDRTSASILVAPKSAIVETNDKKKMIFVQNRF
ncbi:hypothetical protein [Phormidesmis priestleyi]|uniref:hypothetical protein n=1 Tax=Phormidesmis priestleyi TaxID=268141 RepID=UPI0009335EAC|nr:hypothetical protein [Phormidesmis priestleyi]